MSMSMSISMSNNNDSKDDDHEHDVVMPGFRFHPTEEELVEFYLRRKVEGKRFNVELITFLDLYRYDPWELPALAAVGEKEWFFYVPRDRKYRNGDRPNRVTTSGYWKATGADRMIKSENSRSIGLKKTLVFYSGKAPKGIRTSWIMNEYRLPQHETERYQKAEISLCRVHKRPGVEDHTSLPRCLPTSKASSSRTGSSRSTTRPDKILYYHHRRHGIERLQGFGGQSSHQQMEMVTDEKMSTNTDQTDGSSSSCSDVAAVLGLSKQNVYRPNMASITTSLLGLPSSIMEEQAAASTLVPSCTTTTLFPVALSSSSSSSLIYSDAADEFHGLLTYPQASMNHHQQYYNIDHHLHLQELQPQSLNLLATPLPAAFSDRLWEWNPILEASREYNDPFK
ncbi:NAC domain-containing protein 35 [Citrus sinensis]|uniref:NAC domain-containing protein n=3 Tax=Citrus TaxID=2706 RepID=V4UXU1_CITCL|nr:NAC domain-containing protein 35 [Citrus x clementina]XP_006470801.2 NAC domain-containing protein 35-like [Citrus sinensis]XP_052296504.1 NAC domain-containing protein 35-like [Citrus sinensis]ESR44623.1 hypothetical protein CICLE_v10001401mg [Citrus x clementina]ESR44624.1 hypothetical protein CICLE_v10001401mg [Citrus x clementina]KAH9684364.1 NAC domain-containing protein 35 [Citrus sinensis]